MVAALGRPEISGEVFELALASSARTLAYAVAGVSLAAALALPTGVLASGTLTERGWARAVMVAAVRALLGFLRAIHELVWAWLLVAAVGLSPLAAIGALALAYAGILGRIYADLLNDVPQEPLRALRSAGASRAKVVLYGRFPMALPDMVAYTLYRLECGIRSAALMGFVGLDVLGYQIQLALDDLRYPRLWTLMGFLLALVIGVDQLSARVRKVLVA